MNSIVNDHIIALKKTIHLINKKMLLFNTEQKIMMCLAFIYETLIILVNVMNTEKNMVSHHFHLKNGNNLVNLFRLL